MSEQWGSLVFPFHTVYYISSTEKKREVTIMKKRLMILLALMLVAVTVLSGCGSGSKKSSKEDTVKEEEKKPIVPEYKLFQVDEAGEEFFGFVYYSEADYIKEMYDIVYFSKEAGYTLDQLSDKTLDDIYDGLSGCDFVKMEMTEDDEKVIIVVSYTDLNDFDNVKLLEENSELELNEGTPGERLISAENYFELIKSAGAKEVETTSVPEFEAIIK